MNKIEENHDNYIYIFIIESQKKENVDENVIYHLSSQRRCQSVYVYCNIQNWFGNVAV